MQRLTICDSIVEISKQRFVRQDEKLIPSFQFKAIIDFDDFDVWVVLPTYKISSLRIIFELFDGIRLDPDSYSKFIPAVELVLKSKTLAFSFAEVQKELEELRAVRQQWGEYKELFLESEMFSQVESFVSAAGGKIFLYEPSSEEIDKLIATEAFEKRYCNISSNTEVCCVGEQVVYYEDLYSDDLLSLSALNKYTSNLFSEDLLLRDVLNQPSVTDGQRALFKRTRCSCGADLVMRRSEKGLTTLNCVNPYCLHKMQWALASFIKDSGILGTGAKSFEQAIQSVWYKNAVTYGKSEVRYSDIVSEEFANFFAGTLCDKYIEFLEYLKSYTQSTKKLIKQCGLPFVGEYAGSALSKECLQWIDSFSAFLVACKGSKIKDLRVAYSLFVYVDDIRHILDMSKCMDTNSMEEFNICITRSVRLRMPDGSVVPFDNKDEFVRYLNEFLVEHDKEHSVHIVLKKSMSSKVRVLINDSNLESTKTRTAREMGIRIIRSCDIFNALKEVAMNEQ